MTADEQREGAMGCLLALLVLVVGVGIAVGVLLARVWLSLALGGALVALSFAIGWSAAEQGRGAARVGIHPATTYSSPRVPAHWLTFDRLLHESSQVSAPHRSAMATEEAGEIPGWADSRAGRLNVHEWPIALSIEGKPPRYVSITAVWSALQRSPWPDHLHAKVIDIIRCEAGADLDGDGVKESVQLNARGDAGRAHGVGQFWQKWWPRLFRAFDLDDLRESLAAMYIAYLEAGRSFWPWSCA